jgi:hypothetical protein
MWIPEYLSPKIIVEAYTNCDIMVIGFCEIGYTRLT